MRPPPYCSPAACLLKISIFFPIAIPPDNFVSRPSGKTLGALIFSKRGGRQESAFFILVRNSLIQEGFQGLQLFFDGPQQGLDLVFRRGEGQRRG